MEGVREIPLSETDVYKELMNAGVQARDAAKLISSLKLSIQEFKEVRV